MANKFRVNQLLLSGQTVTANSNSLFVNGAQVQGGGGGSSTNGVTGLVITGSQAISGNVLFTGENNIHILQFGNTIHISGDTSQFLNTVNLEATGTNLINYINGNLTTITGAGNVNIITGSGILYVSGNTGFLSDYYKTSNPNNFVQSGQFVSGISVSGGNAIQGVFNINAGANVTLTQQGTNTLSISATAGESNLNGLISTGDVAARHSITGVSINGVAGFTGNFNINSNSGIHLTQAGNTLSVSQTGWNSKSIYIENPIPSDSITLFYTQQSIQVQRVKSIIRGEGLGSGLFSIRSDPNREVAGTELLVGGFSVTGRNTGDNFISFSNPTISGENWVWLFVNQTGQTLSGISTTIFYTNNY